jgi:hypothetical protein
MLELFSSARGRLSPLTAAALLTWSSAIACAGKAFVEEDSAPCIGNACVGGAPAGVSDGGASGRTDGGRGGKTSSSPPPAQAGTTAEVAGGSSGGASSHGGTGNSGPSTSAGDGQGGEPLDGEKLPDFPATKVLDDFNRLGLGLGTSWAGAVEHYSFSQQQLWCALCGEPALWAEELGPEQEVFATYARFDADAMEMNLVLKAQEASDCELIEVLYAPEEKTARVAHCASGKWTDSDKVSVELHAGDQFGGRAHADGTVELFVNGESIASFDASAFPHERGRIGVNGLSGPSGNAWDDFGGGEWRK